MVTEFVCECNHICQIWEERCPACGEARGFKMPHNEAVMAYLDFFKKKCLERQHGDHQSILTKEEYEGFKHLFEGVQS